MKFTNNELLDKAILWFRDYAERVKRISAAKISHDTNAMSGYLNMCAEFIEKYRSDQHIYTDIDLCEFAEWCSKNGWVYIDGSDIWGNNVDRWEEKITSQLREIWEVETGRRKP